MNSSFCTASTTAIENYFETNETTTVCRSFPIETCWIESQTRTVEGEDGETVEGFFLPQGSNVTTETQNCVYETPVNTSVCWKTQKNGLDLLDSMYRYFETSCPQQASLGSTVYSSSYGPGCGFDDKVASIPSQLFAFASDPVKLNSDATGLCLSGGIALELVPCVDANAVKWIYVFRESDENTKAGQLFFVDSSQKMICLTRTDGTLTLSYCDSHNGTILESQQWSYDSFSGKLLDPSSNSGSCILGSATLGKALLGSCDDTSSRWSQYSECKLNTRIRTEEIQLELIDNDGVCLGKDGESLTQCGTGDSGVWQYYYASFDSDAARLELLSSETPGYSCLGRVVNEEDVGIEPQTLPTGLVTCDGGEDTEKFPYWYTILGGNETNIFQWRNQLNDEGTYCISIPQTTQEQCPVDLGSVQKWKKYSPTTSGATEISVKPDLTLQTITDPELLFQLFLFTAEGKLSRKVCSVALCNLKFCLCFGNVLSKNVLLLFPAACEVCWTCKRC